MTSSAPERPRGTARRVRIGLLLAVLALVAFDAWIQRSRTTRWETPLRVSLYPIAGDSQSATREYLSALTGEDFSAIEAFIRREAGRHGITLEPPVRLRLEPVLAEHPPAAPAQPNLLSTVWWSLRLRAWAMRMEWDQPRPRSQVRVFVLYYDPATRPQVAHSVGLKEGRIGVVHAFASRSMTATNNVVIAHELLHTLGATDKYDPRTGLPVFPDGYAEPDRAPRHPQSAAELMGGRIPLTPHEAEIPLNLERVMVGPRTAAEIGWTRS